MVVAWMQLGEVYMHLLPMAGNTDSLAKVAFETALALDSTATTHQFHLIEIARRAGDRPRALALATRFARAAADSDLAHDVELIAGCDDQGSMGDSLNDAALRRPLRVLIAARALAPSPRTAACAASSYAALLRADTATSTKADARRFEALLGRAGLLLGAGHADSAIVAIDAYRARWGSGRSVFVLAAPVAPPVFAERARAAAKEAEAESGPNYERLEFAVPLWELGVWAATDGHPATAAAVTAHLARRQAAASATRLDTLVASSMAAHAALAAGDTVLALERFERLIASPAPTVELSWDEAAPLGYDRLVLGRLLLSQHRYQQALGVLEVHDSALPIMYPLYQPASLAVRIEAARALHQTAMATALQQRSIPKAGRGS
jgi:hypothetical protein